LKVPKTTSPPRAWLAGVLLVLGGLVAAACSSAPGAAPPTTAGADSGPATTTSVPPPPLRSTTVTVGGREIAVPTENGAPISPLVGTGDQIVLTAKGFMPYQLFADLNAKIVFTNLTSKPVRITFEHSTVKSPLLEPGDTFSYSSSTLYSFVYRSSTGFHGTVAIGAFQ
jgi:hypothetical protein